MKKNKDILSNILFVSDVLFSKSILIIYFLYFLIILYYVLFFINSNSLNNQNITYLINKERVENIKKVLELIHLILKIFISTYLIVKFNPYIKIKYNSKNDKNIIFNSGLLLLTSTIIIDPLILLSKFKQ